jgi:hypothetical protein
VTPAHLKAKNSQAAELSQGDIVINLDHGETASIGVLVEKCDLHSEYWKVYHEGLLQTWFEPNLRCLSERND